MKIKRGLIIVFTEGEYSDYTLMDAGRALKCFDMDEVVKVFMGTNDFIGERNSYINGKFASGNAERFLAWLIRENYIEMLPTGLACEWYLGSYGDLEDNKHEPFPKNS